MKILYSISLLFLFIILISCEKDKSLLSPYISSNFNILYHSDNDIFIMDSNGRHKKNLTIDLQTGGYSFNRIQDVTSDGQKILFEHTSLIDSIDWEIKYEHKTYIMSLNGEDILKLSDTSLVMGQSKFSPDGSYIVTNESKNINDIFVMNSDGSGIRNLTNDSEREWCPQFSHDGSKVFYISKYNIYSINFDGSDKKRLTNVGYVSTRGFNLSYDRYKIVFTSSKYGTENIYLIYTDGNDQRRITYSPGSENPSFSYDNFLITFISWSMSGYDIKIIDDTGKNEKKLASTLRPNNDYWRPVTLFSPDDKYIIYTCYIDGNFEIFITDINGKNKTNLTNNPGSDNLGIVFAVN